MKMLTTEMKETRMRMTSNVRSPQPSILSVMTTRMVGEWAAPLGAASSAITALPRHFLIPPDAHWACHY